MSNPYKTRKGGATVTVFAPYDCGNHCPFCINKGDYADTSWFDQGKIEESIRLMDSITPECDFVFTGGEPLADRKNLQKMIDLIPPTHRLFINTTLPVFEGQSEEDLIEFTEHNKDKLTCINISRHMQHYVTETPDSYLAELKCPVRVNCVLYKEYPADRLPEYLDRWVKYGIPVQFRFDYTATTPENLYDREHDPILADLNKIADYTGLDGCRMRCGFHFNYKGLELTYHKTLPYSTIVETDPEDGKTYDILYDICIRQNGEIRSDWDDTKLDVEAYRNVKFEPYDLHIIEGDLKHTTF